MILISSGGYIYTQDMDSSSSAVHGPFYVTNTIDIVHPDISVSTNIILTYYGFCVFNLLTFMYILGCKWSSLRRWCVSILFTYIIIINV